jgi:transcription antitermination factor NusG
MYTRPNHEKKVAVHLNEKKIECYLPLVKTLRQWHDRKKFVDMPIFPSYVFVYLDNWTTYHDALEDAGALYFIKTGTTMAKVEKSVIDNIKLVVGHKDNDLEVVPLMEPGQPVVINEGPFAGFSGQMVQHQGKRKIQVRVHLLQRSLLVSIAPEYLMVV